MSETTSVDSIVRRMFDAAADLPAAERAPYLDRECPEGLVRQQVDALLAAMEKKSSHVREALGQFQQLRPGDEVDPMIGRSIGIFRVLKQLGRGGMGRVYLALRDEPFKQYVALKLVRPDLHSGDLKRRFEMERQILASLNHPGIARLIDGGTTEDGLAFLAMEYVEGQSITAYCDSRSLSVRDRLDLFKEICRAVHYAHQNLIVHRDLKPSNILVTDDPDGTRRVKLLDFGIAKLLNPHLNVSDVPVTRAAQQLMTPEYAAPEQVRGDQVTTATDVYALGVILYELLSGYRPHQFANTSPSEIERVLCEQEPHKPSTRVQQGDTRKRAKEPISDTLNEEVGRKRGVSNERLQKQLRGDLDNMVMMALRKEPHRRYGSAENFAEDIERYLNDQPIEARANTIGYRMRKFVSRHRWETVISIFLVLFLVAYGISSNIQAARISAERDRAEMALAQSEELTEFLMGLFTASHTNQALGEQLTALELLERGSERADKLDDQPEVKGRMLDVLGQVYQSMGAYEEAQRHLENALEVKRTTLGPEHEEVAYSLNHLANTVSARGQEVEAESLYIEALAIKKNVFGESHPSIALTLRNLGSVKRSQGHYEMSEAYMLESIEMYRGLPGQDEAEIASVLNGLAVLYRHQSRYDEAEKVHREALDIRRRIYGNNHPEVATSLNNLSLLLDDMDRLKEAEQYGREALEMRRRLLGSDHPFVATTLNNLASTLRDLGRNDEARLLFEEALTIRMNALGETHPDMAAQFNNMGSFFNTIEQYEKAEEYYLRALAVLRLNYGNDHPYIPAALNNLSQNYMLQSRYEEAEEAIREAYRMRLDRYGPDHTSVARLEARWSVLHMERGEYKRAEERMLKAHTIFNRELGDEHVLTLRSVEKLKDIYTAMGRPDDAARWEGKIKNADG